MPKFRRDQIPFMPSCFINFVWAFSSFLSVDMIKLYSYQFMHDVNYPGLFYGVFAISFMLLIFLKFNRVFTTVMVVWFNFAVHLMFMSFIYFPARNRIFFMIIFGLWSHLYAMNLISTVYLASYNLGGLHGLIMGTTMAYYLGYFLQHAVEHPSDFSIASRRSTCNWFIAIRFITSVISFKFYRDYLEFFFYFEYNDAVKRTSMTDMFKWVDGKPVEIMSSVRITELMPSSIDYECVKHLFMEHLDTSTVYLILIYFSYVTTSFFSPLLSPTPLVLSIFVRNEVYFVEFWGGLLGITAAILLRRNIENMALVVYGVHVFFAIASSFGFNTRLFNTYKHKNVLYGLSFLSSCLGTFVLVYSFINFISLNSIVSCTNQKKKHTTIEECVVCCKNDTATCLCYNKNTNETCSHTKKEDAQENRLACANIWVPWNNHSTYRDWTYSDCEFCLSQNYSNTKAKCNCTESDKGGNEFHCCTCACSICKEKDVCGCTCKGEGECAPTCCCQKKNKRVVNYILRNCIVSCCPYCDMCLLLECVKVECVCPCKHRDHKPRNAIESDTKEEEMSLTKIRLRMDINQNKHLFLCTYSDAPASDLEYLKKQFCCCEEEEKCKGQECCIKCCKRCKKKGDSCGKHFNIADYKTSSCCHYDLKVWMSLKELNTMFHIGQRPFKNKYEQINSLVFANEACRHCCKTSSCCTKAEAVKGKCTDCRSADIVKLIENSSLSQSGGAVKLKCVTRGCTSSVSSATRSDNVAGSSTNSGPSSTPSGAVGPSSTSDNPKSEPSSCKCCCCCSKGVATQSGTVSGKPGGTGNESGTDGAADSATESGKETKDGKCKCSCSSRTTAECQCKENRCRAVKVLPTNLPYQFRGVDIKRNEVISLLGFTVVLFCVVKLIMALGFSLINQRDSLKLSFVVGDFTSINGMTIKTFPMEDYESDKKCALQRVENYNGPDEFLINYAIDLEVKDLEDRTRGIKEMMDELNSLKFDRWLEEIIKAPFEVMSVGYTKLRFYKHLNRYIDQALMNHAFKTADRIFVYFDKFPERWNIEWSDFERRFLQNLKVYTSYSLSLNSVGYFDTNTEFQKLINNRQSLILEHLNSKNDNLTGYLTKNRDLLEKYRKASPHRKLPRYIDLWEYRTNLIKGWAADKTLFLNWTPFVVSMERILLWNKLYRGFYMRAFRERYGEADSTPR